MNTRLLASKMKTHIHKYFQTVQWARARLCSCSETTTDDRSKWKSFFVQMVSIHIFRLPRATLRSHHFLCPPNFFFHRYGCCRLLSKETKKKKNCSAFNSICALTIWLCQDTSMHDELKQTQNLLTILWSRGQYSLDFSFKLTAIREWFIWWTKRSYFRIYCNVDFMSCRSK